MLIAGKNDNRDAVTLVPLDSVSLDVALELLQQVALSSTKIIAYPTIKGTSLKLPLMNDWLGYSTMSWPSSTGVNVPSELELAKKVQFQRERLVMLEYVNVVERSVLCLGKIMYACLPQTGNRSSLCGSRAPSPVGNGVKQTLTQSQSLILRTASPDLRLYLSLLRERHWSSVYALCNGPAEEPLLRCAS